MISNQTIFSLVAVVFTSNLAFGQSTDLASELSKKAVAKETPRATVAQIEGVSVNEGSLDYVACTTSDVLNVRDESLSKILFSVSRYETVLPVQSFGTDKEERVVGGKSYTFVKIQAPGKSSANNTGWIAEDYMKLKSDCAGAPKNPEIKFDSIEELAASAVWNFPTSKRPLSSYKEGQLAFRAGRGGGTRLHAACDIYRTKDEPAQSVFSGTVLRDRYFFYEGTYALEVKHTGGRIVRYGEITGKAASGVSSGRSVTSGQTVGYIGKVNSGCCTPMLHFEMYSGTGSGSLTQSGNKFLRRSDLINPTSDLSTWEKAKFGASY